ncbi:PIG-L family deacetylase [Paenibacillus silvisoli]|uniref:PIG-L family deacetylase n=1 Tax=Paenibacillus silvisoli TaxID=3110539 RepID=UPI0028051E1C|nr:PIG-L family deacetylase [Paenibacillus silvisoli]
MSNLGMLAGRKLLAIFAHPDDESFICGGTLAKYASLGVEITLISATRGEMGRRMGNPPYLNRETMPEVREKELKEACEHLGIRHLTFLDIRDKTVEFTAFEALVARTGRFIEEIKPDIVLTFHERFGGHPDHCAIGRAATEAWRRFGTPRSSLYFISYGNELERPQRFGYEREHIVRIDVRDHLRAKLAAFRAHRCQTEIDEWVWGADEAALAKFGKHEYFMAGDVKKPLAVRDDLFQQD